MPGTVLSTLHVLSHVISALLYEIGSVISCCNEEIETLNVKSLAQ